MKEKFMALPEALQKQLIIRFGAGSVFLILTILILVLYKDVYLLIPCLVFAAFFYVNGIYVWHTVTENRYIILEGLCSSVDKTPLRKRVKNIYLETEAGTVKIVIRQCIKQMEKGDNIRVYISKHTPVYEHDQCKVLCSYLALEKMRKGNNNYDSREFTGAAGRNLIHEHSDKDGHMDCDTQKVYLALELAKTELLQTQSS